VFNELSKITGIKSTIIISAILFTMLHLSLLSIFWIFPIGLIFGYFRAKYNTLWYGIIGHLIYNSCIVLIEIIVNSGL
jgi:membrane protease YdiL (CAAX protease family)